MFSLTLLLELAFLSCPPKTVTSFLKNTKILIILIPNVIYILMLQGQILH